MLHSRELPRLALYWFSRSWQTCSVFFLLLCEHLWDPPGTNFLIFQHHHHHFQHTEASIQLLTQFPDCNLLIHTNDQDSLFYGATAVHGHVEIWLVFHTAAITLKSTTHPLTVLTFTVWSPSMFSKCQ